MRTLFVITLYSCCILFLVNMRLKSVLFEMVKEDEGVIVELLMDFRRKTLGHIYREK